MASTSKNVKLIAVSEPMRDGRKIARVGIALLVVAFGGFGLWAALAPLSGAVIVQGTVKVLASRKTVQHLEGGIVKEILVREGDRVEKGQRLIVLDDVQPSAAVGVLQGQLDSELAKQARLNAEIARARAVEFPADLTARKDDPKVAAIMQAERKVFDARRRLLQSQVELLQGQIKEVGEEAAGWEQRIKAVDQSLGYIAEQLQINETLRDQNFVSRSRVLDMRRQLAEKEEARGEYLASLAQARQKTKELQLRIASLYETYLKEAADELKQTRKNLADLQDRMRPSQDQLSRAVIAAPLAGEVVDLRVHTVGGVITPREPLMDIVPADASLIVEGKMLVKDIRHVQVGADVDVQLTAYKRRITPRVPGKLSYVSADSLTDEKAVPGEPREYYLVRITVHKKDLNEAGNLELTPGMPVEAYIKTQDRTLVEYMLQPITDSMRRAFREY
jgi:HlyD family type I secretion membrane fusion protein